MGSALPKCLRLNKICNIEEEEKDYEPTVTEIASLLHASHNCQQYFIVDEDDTHRPSVDFTFIDSTVFGK
jgi:hypothetical protein